MSDKKKYTKFILDMDFDPESKDVEFDVRGVDSSKRVEQELRANDAFEKMLDRLSKREGKQVKKVRTFDRIRGDDESL